MTLYTWDTRGGKHKVCSLASLNLPSIFQGVQARDMFSERLAVRLESRGTLYIKVCTYLYGMGYIYIKLVQTANTFAAQQVLFLVMLT